MHQEGYQEEKTAKSLRILQWVLLKKPASSNLHSEICLILQRRKNIPGKVVLNHTLSLIPKRLVNMLDQIINQWKDRRKVNSKSISTTKNLQKERKAMVSSLLKLHQAFKTKKSLRLVLNSLYKLNPLMSLNRHLHSLLKMLKVQEQMKNANLNSLLT